MENWEFNEGEGQRPENPSSSRNNKNIPSNVCYNYAEYKYCKYGVNCKFLHHGDFLPSQNIKTQSLVQQFKSERYYSGKVFRNSDEGITKSINSYSNIYSQIKPKINYPICRYFKLGHCNYGDRCLYNHLIQHKSLDSCFPSSKKEGSGAAIGLEPTKNKTTKKGFNIKQQSIPTCRYFQKGNCQKGDQCQYFHPQYPSVENNSFVPRLYKPNSKCNNSSQANKESHGAMSNTLVDRKDSEHIENVCQQRNLDIDLSSINQNTSELLQAVQSENCTKMLSLNQNKESNVFFNTKSSEISTYNTDEDNLNNLLLKSNINLITNKCTTPNDNSKICGNENLQFKGIKCDSTINFVRSNNGNPSVATEVENKLCPINRNKHSFSLLTLSENEILQLRCTELNQMKKRFPNLEVIEEDKSFTFIFQPSDPDWPFDLQNLKLLVTFPKDYPTEVCEIKVMETIDYMPESLIRYLNQSISDWLRNRHQAFLECSQIELIFRPFLKWLDRNLEELFKYGLKRDQEAVEVESEIPFPVLGIESEKVIDNSLSAQETSIEKIEEDISQISISEQKKPKSADSHTNQCQGVKVLFGGLEFVEGIAAMSCTRLSSTFQCARCKTLCNLKSMPNKNYSLTCSKCSRNITCNFNPTILHPFSNLLGTLYLTECRPVDLNLVECVFLVDCLSCSKQVTVDSIHYGQKQKLWCKFCNQKFIVGIESAKFQASPTSCIDTKTVKIVNKSEKKKDPLIKAGLPLPEFGACKHYKKSNRWLRFPCCGRIYPCDVCHDEKEMDHEMKFASRMICGFCSTEQPYSKEKPCISCSSGMVAKSSVHWEGGKGCRNKIKMSRDDKHKFAGTNKTISKKAQSTGTKKKK